MPAPIGFAVVSGVLSVQLPAGAAPSSAPALTLAGIPVTAKIVLDPAVLGGGGWSLVHFWNAHRISHRISHRIPIHRMLIPILVCNASHQYLRDMMSGSRGTPPIAFPIAFASHHIPFSAQVSTFYGIR